MTYRGRPHEPVDVESFVRIPSRPAQGIGIPGSPQSQRPINVVEFSPRIYASAGSQQFSTQGVVSVGPGPVTVVIAAAFRIPTNSVGIVRELTWDANDTLASSLIFFTLRFNQGPVQGYARYQMFPSAAARQSVGFGAVSTFIDMPAGASIDVIANVQDAGTYLLGANVRGWYFSQDIAARYGYR